MIKLCIVGDFTVQSGFGRTNHQIAEYLYDTEEYEIKVIGINYHGEPNYYSKKYDVYPASAMGNTWGEGMIRRVRENFNPDVWFLYQDHWNLYRYMLPELSGARGVVACYPLDSPNIIPDYMYAFTDVSCLALHTEFAIQETMKSCKVLYDHIIKKAKAEKVKEIMALRTKGLERPIDVNVSRMKELSEGIGYDLWDVGVDTRIFYPMDKAECRMQMGLQKNKFIVGYVSNNDYRKRNFLLIQALKYLPKDVVILFHCAPNQPTGWNLPQLADYYGVSDRVIFSHYLSGNTHPQHPFTEAQLRVLYNCMDVHINVSGGEGWGVPVFESAACRVPQIVPDYSATGELWKDKAVMLEPDWFIPSERINTVHAVYSPQSIANSIQLLMDETYNNEVAERCYNHALDKLFRWETIGNKMDEIFKEHVCKKPMQKSIIVKEQ